MRIVSPIPSASSVPRPTADFSEPDHFVPASVMPRCSGYGMRSRQQPVGGDRVRHVRRLDRDLEVLEGQPLHELDELDGGGHERLDRVLALERVEVLGQRPGVHADPHRGPGGAGAVGDLGDLVGPADVARVQADAVCAGVDGLERERVVEVDVGDDRDRALAHDRPERLDVLVARHGDAHDVGARVGHLADLVHRGREVRGLRLGHRLDDDGRAPADLDAPHVHVSLRSHVGPVYEATARARDHAARTRSPPTRAARSRAPRSPRAYFSAIGLRLSFIVGVSSSPPGAQSPGTMHEALDLLDPGEPRVGRVDARPAPRRASPPRPRAPRATGPRGPAWPPRPARSRRRGRSARCCRRRPSPITHAWPMSGRGALELGLDVRRRHVLAGRGDDELLLAIHERDVAVRRRSSRCRPCAASRRRRAPRRSCSGAWR